jgi:hypothetical protein
MWDIYYIFFTYYYIPHIYPTYYYILLPYRREHCHIVDIYILFLSHITIIVISHIIILHIIYHIPPYHYIYHIIDIYHILIMKKYMIDIYYWYERLIFTLWLFNITIENPPIFKNGVYHLFLWAMASKAMLVITRG